MQWLSGSSEIILTRPYIYTQLSQIVDALCQNIVWKFEEPQSVVTGVRERQIG